MRRQPWDRQCDVRRSHVHLETVMQLSPVTSSVKPAPSRDNWLDTSLVRHFQESLETNSFLISRHVASGLRLFLRPVMSVSTLQELVFTRIFHWFNLLFSLFSLLVITLLFHCYFHLVFQGGYDFPLELSLNEGLRYNLSMNDLSA